MNSKRLSNNLVNQSLYNLLRRSAQRGLLILLHLVLICSFILVPLPVVRAQEELSLLGAMVHWAEWRYGALSDDYHDHWHKHLGYVTVGTPGIGIVDGSITVYFDLDDYYSGTPGIAQGEIITEEGADGLVTVWVDVNGSLGVDVSLVPGSVGITRFEMEPGVNDPDRQFGLKELGWEFGVWSCTLLDVTDEQGHIGEFSQLELVSGSASLTLLELSANVYRAEVDRQDLDDFISAATIAAAGGVAFQFLPETLPIFASAVIDELVDITEDGHVIFNLPETEKFTNLDSGRRHSRAASFTYNWGGLDINGDHVPDNAFPPTGRFWGHLKVEFESLGTNTEHYYVKVVEKPNWLIWANDDDGPALRGFDKRFDITVDSGQPGSTDWLISNAFGAITGTVTFELYAADFWHGDELLDRVKVPVQRVQPPDGEGPQIQHTPIDSATTGQDLVITAEIQDNGEVDNAWLFYRWGADPWQHVEMQHVAGDLYQATIPAEIIAEPWVCYYLVATDGVLSSYEPSSGFHTFDVIPQPIINSVNVESDQATYDPSENVTLNVTLQDDDNAPVVGATLEYTLDGAPHDCGDPGVTCTENGDGEYTIVFSAPAAARDYDVVVEASKEGYLPGSGATTITVAPEGEPGHKIKINNIFVTPGSYDPWDYIHVVADAQNIGLHDENVRLVFRLRDPSGTVVDTDDDHTFPLQAGYLSSNYSVDLRAASAEGDYKVEVTAEIIGHSDEDPSDNKDHRYVYVGDAPDWIEYALYDRYAEVLDTTSPDVEGYTILVLNKYYAPDDPDQAHTSIDLLYGGTPVPDGYHETVYVNRINLFDNNQAAVILDSVFSTPDAALYRLGKGGTTGITFDPGTAVVPAGGTAIFRTIGPVGSNLEDFVVDICESYANDDDCDDDYAIVSTWNLDDDEVENHIVDVMFDVPPDATPRTYEFWLTFEDRNGDADNIIRKLWIEVEPRHDVQVSALTPSNDTIAVGTTVPIQATVVNVGGHTEYALDAICTITGPGGYSKVMEQSISSLGSGATTYPAFNWATGGLAPGSYTIHVEVPLSSDAYPGNNSSAVSNSLVLPPQLDVTLTASESSWVQMETVRITGTVSANSNPVSAADMTYWLVDSGGQTIKVGDLADAGGGTYTGSFAAPMATGLYTLTLTAEKAGYLSGSSAPLPLLVETAPPDTHILNDNPSEGELINYNDVPFEWLGTDPNTPTDQLQYSYKLDDEPWASFSSGTSHLFADILDGPHQFSVKTRNLASLEDPTPATRSFAVDTVAPVFEVPPTADAEVYEDGDTVQVTIDLDSEADITANFSAIDSQFNPADVIVTETDPVNHIYSVSYMIESGNSYPDNQYAIVLIAKDAAGNTRTDASLQVHLDNENPSIVAKSPDQDEIAPVFTDIAVTFSEPMDQASVAGAFAIEPSVSGANGWTGKTFVFSPDNDLLCETQYTATVSIAAVDMVGKSIVPISWSFDTGVCGPRIVHTPITTAIEDTPVPIIASVTSETLPITVTLHYRITGAPVYTDTPMSNTSGDVYSATIPASAVTSAGVDYYISVTDGVHMAIHPPAGAHYIQVSTLCDTVSQIPKAECDALVALYDSTDGANWSDNTGWLDTNTPCSDWYGVGCSGGHVVQLYLENNQLSGSIPSEIGYLTNLRVLWLSANQLTSGIPSELGNLSNLEQLVLYNNQLSGGVPSELGNLTNLTYLWLYDNQLTGGIPTELSDMSSLQILYLSNNLLNGNIPPELGELDTLTYLALDANDLDGAIPPELGNLVNLQILRLNSNQLSGSISSQLGNLSNLSWLYLFNNRLDGGIPPELGNLTSLERLRIQNNALEGEIPTTITNLVSLIPGGWETDLDYNKLISSDPAVIAFLNDKDPDWANTQTVPPTDVQVVSVSGSNTDLSWTPITYTWDGGYYQVSFATTPGGPYTIHGTTASKAATGYLADSLLPGTTYYFVVRTYTPAHGDQQNNLSSAYSQEVSATTSLAFDHWYVATTGNDANDCQSPATACQTIQAAIDKASSNHTVNVVAGTYYENVVLKSNLTLQGVGPHLCTIAGHGQGVIGGAEGAIVRHFTIANDGTGTSWGFYGDAVMTFRNNVFTGHYAGVHAGQMYPVNIINNVFVNNDTAIVFGLDNAPVVRNNIIVGNSSGFWWYGSSAPQADIDYNDVWNNGVNYDNGAQPGPNDISVDPLFVDESSGNYHLQGCSPAVDAGDPSSDYSNEPAPNGGRINMGAYGNTTEATSLSCTGTAWYVSTTGNDSNDCLSPSTPCRTIQAAINKASVGDTVNVAAGTYMENVILQDDVNLIGAGMFSTIVDANGVAKPLYLTSGVHATVQYMAFTNSGTGYTDAVLDSGVVIGNGSAITLTHCRVFDNESVGILSFGNDLIAHNLIENNTDGVFVSSYSAAIVHNNTIVNNTNQGVFVHHYATSAHIFNNIIAGNGYYGVSGFNGGPAVPIDYNDFWNNAYGDYGGPMQAGIDNIYLDPFFVDASSHDYRLLAESPAINAGNPDPQYNDPDGSRNDIGAFPFSGPMVPTDLDALAISNGQIDLSWTDNSDESDFHVERSLDGSTGWTETATVGANVTSHSDTGLTCDTTYYYRVRAYRHGDGQYSGYSNVANDSTLSCSGTVALFPFYDGFESAGLSTGWSTYTTTQGRVRVDTAYPYTGSYGLLLDDYESNGTDSYAAAILTIDLLGRTDVVLDFWWREFQDENDPGDGVFISDDNGVTWHQAFSFNDGPSTFRRDIVDIGTAAAANGLTLNDHFQIRFQFQDEYSIPTDGYAIDEVRVHQKPAHFPFYDGFESGTLGTGWLPNADNEGRVQVSASYPYTGSYSLLLDDEVGNTIYSHAAAELMIDLSGQPNVLLGFWWREFNDEDDADDGVFISGDYGVTWHRVFSFTGNTFAFTQTIIDLDVQTLAAGMNMNDHFLVKFQFYDNYPINSDGYAIDQVSIGTSLQQCYSLSTSVSPSSSGSVSVNPPPNCGGGQYAAGTQVQLTANPVSGYDFDTWSGDALGSANPITITMDGDKSVTANFATASGVAVAIYDHATTGDISYWSGGNTNQWDEYRTILENDPEGRFAVTVITDLLPSTLSSFDRLILPDNAVPDADLAAVDAWFTANKRIIAVDSAVNFAAYTGYVWPTSSGSNGYGVYWNYSSSTDDQLVVLLDKITEDYDVGGVIYARSGDAQMFASLLPSDAIALTAKRLDLDKVYAAYRIVPGRGTIVVLGPYSPAAAEVYELVRDAVEGGSRCQDYYEPDDISSVARQIIVDGPVQSHNFHQAGDNDWTQFSASAGAVYTITTSDLGSNSDTYLYLYDTDGGTEITHNDDYSGLASQIVWQAPSAGDYYILVRHYNAGVGGCSGYEYDLRVEAGSVSSDTHTITGYVRDSSSNGIGGVAVDFGGAQPAVTTDASGYYSQSGFVDGNYAVSFSLNGYAFSPVVDQVTISGADTTHDVTGYPFNPTSLPFSDGFESGGLGSAWAVETDYEGRVRVDSTYPYAGNYSLLLDDHTSSGFISHASAILALDLSGQTQVEMSFWWREFGDEDHPDDGVFISDDYGVTWHLVFQFAGNTTVFTQTVVDLDDQASAAGMSLNDHFLVKFQFYDGHSIPTDGYAIDDVQIYIPDTQAPTGGILINNGDTYTNNAMVNMILSASDNVGVTEMRLYYNGAWHSWEIYATSKSIALAGGDGTGTVYVQYRDAADNSSNTYSDSIILDTTPPTSAIDNLSPVQSNISFDVSWSGSDATSGVSCYDVQYRDGLGGTWGDWFSCASNTSEVFNGEEGHTYYFRSRAQDNAGNWENYPTGPDYDTYTAISVESPSEFRVYLPAVMCNH